MQILPSPPGVREDGVTGEAATLGAMVGGASADYIPFMNRRGMGVGFVAVLIVVAIVLVATARAWKSVEPTALQVMRPGSRGSVPAHGDAQAAAAVQKGDLPDLQDMKEATDVHSKQVEEAAAASAN